MNKLVIFGAGQTAEIALSYVESDSGFEVVGFAVDGAYQNVSEFHGRPVVAFENVVEHFSPETHQMLVLTSYREMNRLRERKYHEAKAMGYRLANYVSSRATVFSNSEIGDNCFIMDNVTVQPFARLGNDVVCQSGSIVGHHAVVGDHCFLAAQAVLAGSVVTGRRCFFGLQSVVAADVIVRDDTLVGAGSLVQRATPDRGVYITKNTPLFSKRSDQLGALMRKSLFASPQWVPETDVDGEQEA